MCCHSKQLQNVTTIIDKLTLDEYHKNVFKVRYLPLLKEYRRRANIFAALFHSMRAIVTVGSIIVPALLTLSSDTAWLTWTISLAVTVSNGILTLFKIDKKYYSLHTTMHVLETEGWQYISLAGKYSKQRDHSTVSFSNSHKYQFIYFCLAIEKIKMLQIQEEYWKAQEEKEKPGPHTSSTQSIVPATASPQKAASNEEILLFIQGIVEDSKKATANGATNDIVPPSEKSDI